MRACSASAKVRGVILTPDQRLRVFVSSTLQELAAELLGTADALRVRLHGPLWGPAVERHERLVEELRDSLGEAAFRERYDVGQALAPGDANDLAVRIAAVPAAVSG
jgi:hypothetical protein